MRSQADKTNGDRGNSRKARLHLANIEAGTLAARAGATPGRDLGRRCGIASRQRRNGLSGHDRPLWNRISRARGARAPPPETSTSFQPDQRHGEPIAAPDIQLASPYGTVRKET